MAQADVAKELVQIMAVSLLSRLCELRQSPRSLVGQLRPEHLRMNLELAWMELE